jgi:hypothetical protein
LQVDDNHAIAMDRGESRIAAHRNPLSTDAADGVMVEIRNRPTGL